MTERKPTVDPTSESVTASGVSSDVAATKSQANASIDTSQTGAPKAAKSNAPETSVPTHFGRYKIEKELGKGAMGVVYLAEDTTIGRKVALKIPKKSILEEPDALERFYREAKTTGQIRHPNICPVFDVGAIDGTHYLTMAYIPGKPVNSFLGKGKLPAAKQVALLIRKIALALEEAHKQGVVHRDLKPSNVMLDDRGEPIVMDFGLACQTNTTEQARLTQSGAILGTPAYMAPEQVRGELNQIGPQSDVYALGVMMYQFLTGELPFNGPIMLVFAQIISNQAKRPSEVRPEVDPTLEAICLKMMAKEIEQRYASMKEVAAALTEYIKKGSVTGLETTSTISPSSTINELEPNFDDLPEFPDLAPEPRRPRSHRTAKPRAVRAVNKTWIAVGTVASVAVIVLLAAVFLMRNGTVAVKITIDDPTAVVKVDGRQVQINGDGVGEVHLTLDAHSYTVARNDQIIRGPEQFTITRDGKKELEITQTKAAGDGSTVATVDSTSTRVFPVGAVYKGTWGFYPAGSNTVRDTFSGSWTAIKRSGNEFEADYDVELPNKQIEHWITKGRVIAGESGNGTIVVKEFDFVDGVHSAEKGTRIVADIENNGTTLRGTVHLANGSRNEFETTLSNPEILQAPVTVSLPSTYRNILGMEFVLVPKGKSWLGGGGGKIGDQEIEFPDDFYLGKYEVAQDEWEKVTGKTLDYFTRAGLGKALVKDVTDADLKRLPIATASWDNCQEFLTRLNEKAKETGWLYRLPTEEEWEYACRGGTMFQRDDSKFDFYFDVPSNQLLPEQANFGHSKALNRPSIVGSYKPNRLGLYNLHGNVWEWCNNLIADGNGVSRHVLRGGGFAYEPGKCRAASRDIYAPGHQFWGAGGGLRVARVHTALGSTITTKSGLKYLELKLGDGQVAKPGDSVSVHYTGWLSDGTKFDSSFDRNEILKTKLQSGKVILGWIEGIAGMRVGGKRKLYIPAKLGYDQKGSGTAIPPNAALIFEIELLTVLGDLRQTNDRPNAAPLSAVAPFDAAQARKHQEEWAAYLNVPVEYENALGMKFRLIPPGEFVMGSTRAQIEAALKDIGAEDKHWQECVKSEAPQHKVILTQPIYLGMHEVTQGQYEKIMEVNPSRFAKTGTDKQFVEKVAGLDTTSHPVENVSWNDAAQFCAKLSQLEKLKPFYDQTGQLITSLDGTGYRLPSEAEWEFACRAGTTTRFWIGDQDEGLKHVGWFNVNSGGRTHTAGELKANPFGLSDIHGHVFEWVQDWWNPTYYEQFLENAAINPSGPTTGGSQRVVRGGDWFNPASFCPSSHRHAFDPKGRHGGLGFRVVLTVDAVKEALANIGNDGSSKFAEANGGFIPLFNGKDLAGWIGKPDVWKLENGELIGTIPGKTQTYLFSQKNYKDFELAFEVRLSGDDANAGVQFHSQISDATQFLMTGPQCEIGRTGKTGWGGLWWEQAGQGRVVSAMLPTTFEKLIKPDGFNEMTLRCVGKKVTITLNGTTTVDGDYFDLHDGLLGWQLVSRSDSTVEMRVRNIRIMPLDNPPVTTPTSPPDKPKDVGWIDLFNGKDLSNWVTVDGKFPGWKVENGYVEVVPGNKSIMTGDKYPLDFELHVEFWLPDEKAKTGPRGHSGVYLLGRHEIQIYDSFSHQLPNPKGVCGALWGEIAPAANACTPPETWQTFDITFRGPRVNKQKKVTTPGRLTLVHNGKKVINDGRFSTLTSAGSQNDNAGQPGPIVLQDGGLKARFRNLRIRPTKK